MTSESNLKSSKAQSSAKGVLATSLSAFHAVSVGEVAKSGSVSAKGREECVKPSDSLRCVMNNVVRAPSRLKKVVTCLIIMACLLSFPVYVLHVFRDLEGSISSDLRPSETKFTSQNTFFAEKRASKSILFRRRNTIRQEEGNNRRSMIFQDVIPQICQSRGKDPPKASEDDISILKKLGGAVDIVVPWFGEGASEKMWKEDFVSVHKELSPFPQSLGDHGELRHVIRSIANYVPWYRHVYLVSAYPPEWLDLKHPCVRHVPLSTVIPNEREEGGFKCNPHAVEWRIAGGGVIPTLSEHFIMVDAHRHFFNSGPVPLAMWHTGDAYKVFHAANEALNNVDEAYTSGYELKEQDAHAQWCARGCPDTILGDGICDHTCDVPSCAGDMGDCASIHVGELEDEVPKHHDTMVDIHPKVSGEQFFLPLHARAVWIDLSSLFSFLPVSVMGASSWCNFRKYTLMQRERGALLLLYPPEYRSQNALCSGRDLNSTVDIIFQNNLFSVAHSVRIFINMWEFKQEFVWLPVPFMNVILDVPASHPKWIFDEISANLLLKKHFGDVTGAQVKKKGSNSLVAVVFCNGSASAKGIKAIYDAFSNVLSGQIDEQKFVEFLQALLFELREGSDCRSNVADSDSQWQNEELMNFGFGMQTQNTPKVNVFWESGSYIYSHDMKDMQNAFDSWQIPFKLVGERYPKTHLVERQFVHPVMLSPIDKVS